VIGPVIPIGAHAPHGGAEDEHRQKEENSDDFEPEGMADLGEGANKSGDTAEESAAGAPRGLAGRAMRHRRGKLLIRLEMTWSWSRRGQAPAGNSGGNSQTDA
jgi:hypothetical protein